MKKKLGKMKNLLTKKIVRKNFKFAKESKIAQEDSFFLEMMKKLENLSAKIVVGNRKFWN